VVSSLKMGRLSRKAIHIDLEVLRNVPLKDRRTLEYVCANHNMSKRKGRKKHEQMEGDKVFEEKV
jgi:hypothetical protein